MRVNNRMAAPAVVEIVIVDVYPAGMDVGIAGAIGPVAAGPVAVPGDAVTVVGVMV